MVKLYVTGSRDAKEINEDDSQIIMTVSRATGWEKGLSPFILGPIEFGGLRAENVENFWQFSKTYIIHVDENRNPTPEYFEWRDKGFNDKFAHRYPMGKGQKPLYSYWNGEKLSYVEERKKIYIPIYYKVVKDTDAFAKLKYAYENSKKDIYLWDFDGYNHIKAGMTYKDVINSETKKMGHAFVLFGMLNKEKALIDIINESGI